ncbi:MAG TPA: hypothetical protein VFU90_11365, partial [Candidatus Tumulicola sp.]|nr:hypothetical protein [Candidatus Tumulicola sp.]
MRANGIVHRALAGLGTAIALARLAARDATGRLVFEALLGVEVLLTRCEDELRSAIPAGQRSVLIGHWNVPRNSAIWKRKNWPRPMTEDRKRRMTLT